MKVLAFLVGVFGLYGVAAISPLWGTLLTVFFLFLLAGIYWA